MDCTFVAETTFGPAVASCRRAFDFTLFFEELFFKLLPSIPFVLVAGARVAVLVRVQPESRRGVLYFAKIVRLLPHGELGKTRPSLGIRLCMMLF